MTIKLYNNTSPGNYVNKVITEVETLTGYLRDSSSITDPTFILERSNPTGFNYAYIPEFERYYFVTGISSDATNLVAVACHVDVLMTYKEQIKQMRAVIRRQEFNYNLMLDDNIFKAYANPKFKLRKFPNSFNDFSYILAVAGNGEESS